MCVIVYKPKDVEIPPKTIGNMWASNPHGAGVVWRFSQGQFWQARKGFLSLAELRQFLSTIQGAETLIHFRQATHGQINPAMTHPFMIGGNVRKLAFNSESGTILMHNGVIAGYGNEQISDTAELCSKTLPYIPAKQRPNLLKAIGGKYALVAGKKPPLLVGNWENHNGLTVSNTYFTYVFAVKRLPKAKPPKSLWDNDDCALPGWSQ